MKKNELFLKISSEKFVQSKKTSYLCIAIEGNNNPKMQNAKIAQLVEHNLAKVRVAGSNPVFRSKGLNKPLFFLCIVLSVLHH